MRLGFLSSYLCLSTLVLPSLAEDLSDGALNQPPTLTQVITDGALKEPGVLYPTRRRLASGPNVEIDLALEAGNHTTVAANVFQTRMLGGSLPGPTIRVRKGDCLVVNFYNKLEEQPGTNDVINEFSFPDSANLHFHGTHVSGERPADDSTLIIDAGESYRYEICFPDFHLGGIFWVHPHRHGSGTLHVGGGAALVLVVEDEPGDLPEEVDNAEEVILMVQLFEKGTFDEKILPAIGDSLFQLELADGIEEDFTLVNGQYFPTLDMTAGEWQRWRVIFGSWNKKPLDLEMDTGGVCEMNLLAKDGIYINDYPRPLSTYPIPVGGRAEIMVRCSAPGIFSVNDYLGGLFKLNVVEPSGGVGPLDPPSAGFEFPKPPYLQDTLSSDPTPGCACETYMDDDKMNGLSYDPEIYLHKIPRGAIVERNVTGVDSHPYHQHVYPFQLKEFFGIDDADAEYFKIGDYHDSVTLRSSETVKIQYEASTFDGRIAVHCHRITHSDEGMLGSEIVIDDGICECSPKENAVGLTLAPTPQPTNRPTKTKKDKKKVAKYLKIKNQKTGKR